MNVFFCMSFLSISLWITPVAGIHFPGGKSVIKLGGGVPERVLLLFNSSGFDGTQPFKVVDEIEP